MANSVNLPSKSPNKLSADAISRVRTASGTAQGAAQGEASADEAFSGVLNTVTGNQAATTSSRATSSRGTSSNDGAANQLQGKASETSTRSGMSAREVTPKESARESSAASRGDKADKSANTSANAAAKQAEDQNTVRANARRDTSRQQDRDDAASASMASAGDASQTSATAAQLPEEDSITDTTTSTTLADSAAELLLMMGVGQAAPATAATPDKVAATSGQDVAVTGAVARNTAAIGNMPANRDIAADVAMGQNLTQSSVTGTNVDTQTALSTGANSQKDSTLAGMAAFMNQMTGKTEQKDARPADVLTNAANLLAAIGSSSNAAGTQSVKDVAAALQSNQPVLSERVGSPAWTHELGSKLVVLSKQDVSAATLHMTPADLGPVRVHIETQQNQANVWFAADHPDTRSAIEQSLPRLREMFMAQGMQLNDAGVSGQSSQQQSAATPSAWRNTAELGEVEAPDTVTVRTLSLKLVDAYA